MERLFINRGEDARFLVGFFRYYITFSGEEAVGAFVCNVLNNLSCFNQPLTMINDMR